MMQVQIPSVRRPLDERCCNRPTDRLINEDHGGDSDPHQHQRLPRAKRHGQTRHGIHCGRVLRRFERPSRRHRPVRRAFPGPDDNNNDEHPNHTPLRHHPRQKRCRHRRSRSSTLLRPAAPVGRRAGSRPARACRPQVPPTAADHRTPPAICAASAPAPCDRRPVHLCARPGSDDGPSATRPWPVGPVAAPAARSRDRTSAARAGGTRLAARAGARSWCACKGSRGCGGRCALVAEVAGRGEEYGRASLTRRGGRARRDRWDKEVIARLFSGWAAVYVIK
ncbi:hypothetical protein AMAG_08944 [Allomyces macrogynus ATCC 38327]|uniref:Uncharacterized protein n=1 Tax=Allomyces macrogynus (strain ATCC 38327) TaxID=578462 RepID=A0A0L0SN16_ALLM3|nr:hypothetical protein AMAG_08944 [Allomyces macrogynus ATCC 38327]|eukprot:KNE63882.1 hypothetical protein AMAG_08944 [Allomyces macrogynus ATCC 38327]